MLSIYSPIRCVGSRRISNVPQQASALLTWTPQTETRYAVWMFSAIYGLHWLHALIMETVQLHMVHVKEILGCRLHCSAPRYQKGDDGKSRSYKERAGSLKLMSRHIYLSVSVYSGNQCDADLLSTYMLALVGIYLGNCLVFFWCRETLVDYITLSTGSQACGHKNHNGVS